MTEYSRAARVADEVNQALARALLTEVRDQRLSGIMITTVRMSADLRNARVYWAPLDSENFSDRDRKRTERSFGRASGFLRSYVAKNVELKYVPELTFRYDDTLETGRRIEELLHDVDIASAEPDGEADE